MKKPILQFGLVALAAMTSANAGVVLTFDLTASGVVAMDQNYGDRVASAMNAAGSYGTFGTGFTPNIVVDYAGGALNTTLTRWTTDYGDLVNVLENEDDGDNRLTITMTADPGFGVRLFGFDLGGWPNANYTIPNLFVRDGMGTNLFSQSNVLVKGAAPDPRHTSFDFAPGLEAQQIQIFIDLTGLGGASDNIGIDNIAFEQFVCDGSAVPEPSSFALLAAGAAGLLLARRSGLKK